MSTNGNETEKGKDHSFMQNSLVHHVFDTKKVVTIGFLGGLIWIIGAVISNYKLALSEIDARVVNHPKIIEMTYDLKRLGEDQMKIKVDVDNNTAILKARRK